MIQFGEGYLYRCETNLYAGPYKLQRTAVPSLFALWYGGLKRVGLAAKDGLELEWGKRGKRDQDEMGDEIGLTWFVDGDGWGGGPASSSFMCSLVPSLV